MPPHAWTAAGGIQTSSGVPPILPAPVNVGTELDQNYGAIMCGFVTVASRMTSLNAVLSMRSQLLRCSACGARRFRLHYAHGLARTGQRVVLLFAHLVLPCRSRNCKPHTADSRHTLRIRFPHFCRYTDHSACTTCHCYSCCTHRGD